MNPLCILYFFFCATTTPIPTPTPQPGLINYAGTAMAYEFTSMMTRQAYPTPTPPINYAGTIAANELASILTKQASKDEAEKAKLAAEQAAMRATEKANYLNATMTADARTAQAQVDLQTAVARETQMYATSFALATATQQAYLIYEQRTMVAGEATARVQPTTDMWTTTAIAQEVAIKQGQVEDVKLAVKRQTMKNMFDALLPWTIVLCLSYVGARGFQTWVKTRTHPRDEHGRQQMFQRELSDGSVVFVNPAQLETGIIKVAVDGEVIRYAPMDKQEQSDITRRSQITDAIAVLPMPYARNAQGMMKTEFGGAIGNPSVQILNEARSLSPVLEEAESKLVEE